MRTTSTLGALALLAICPALLSLGCDTIKAKLGKGGDAGTAVAVAESEAGTVAGAVAELDAGPTAAAPVADDPPPKNAASVARFGSENALGDAEATIKRPARVTSAIPSGADVAAIPAGTIVKQVAEKGGFYRVTFADPKEPTTRLTGWVDKLAFIDPASVAPGATTAATAPKGKKPIKCAAGLVLAGSDDKATPVCSKKCSDDKECNGGECEVSFLFDPDKLTMLPAASSRTMVCIGAKPAPIASSKVDAGAAPVLTYNVGEAVMVEWKNSWYPAKVIAVGSGGKYRIHYDGYGSEWDEFVSPARMKKK